MGQTTNVVHPRIAGGFIAIEAGELLSAWTACVAGPPGIGGFRAWLAAREMVARRRGGAGDRTPDYGLDELARLLGVSARTAGVSVRRLVAAGLIVWGEGSIGFPIIPVTENHPVTESIGSGRGQVAIPRRLLRWLVRGARPALIATALGAILRCVSRRRAGFAGRGRFKSSWVARVFGIAERHARSARAELIALGWLEVDSVDDRQWAWNRWGKAFLVNLGWQAPCNDSPTLPADPGARSSYPESDPAPLRERINPEPGTPGPAGVSLDHGRNYFRATEDAIPKQSPINSHQDQPGQMPGMTGPRPATATGISCEKPLENKGGRPAPSGSRTAQTHQDQPAPNLRDIRPADLADTARTLDLHRQAVEAGWSTTSEADRMRVLAAAEHARTAGTSNPPGLFRAIVQGRRYGLLTQADDDRAARRLREYLRPVQSSGQAARTAPPTATLRRDFSPYAQPAPAREPSMLSGLLARLAAGGP